MNYTEILTGLRKIIRSVNLESKRIEKQFGISIPQLLCLNFLHNQAGFQASQKQIKDFLSLNASTVTGIINRLEKKGLVAKLPKREDRRVSYITITAKGADLIQNTPELLHERLTQKLKSLSSEHLEELRHAFQVIADFLDVEKIDASPILTAEVSIKDADNNIK
jgi:DNA-binding MarR family transcriptional regulator